MTSKPDDNPANLLEQIRKLTRDFGKQISQGKSPRIQKFLSQISEEGHADLFFNLLGIETNYRRSKGESPTSDEYVRRFPQFKKQVRRAFFEPTMGSVDSSASTDGDDQTASLRSPNQVSDAFAPTYELPDANRLGDYELIRKLGQGGMGIVYEARHTKTNNRVALKTLLTGGDGQQINADKLYRFRKEFRRLSEINHPNLVGMQSLEVDGDRWFFTMDLIDGEDFLNYVRPDDRLDEERLRSCLKQLATGVLELHRRGIIHRDLKPSNVLVSSEGHVTILDFGLAAQLQRNSDMTQTKSGMFSGTPPYAAPEQLFGERTEASDWYAFGTMLFEALAGERPFQDPDPMKLLRMKQEQDPPQLSDRDDLPSDLAELTDGLIAREASSRWRGEAIAQVLQLNDPTRTHGTTHGSAGTQGSSGSIGDEEIDLETLPDEEIVLVGREEQLAQLESARQEMLERRQPILVWISGLSGEGKSSLCEKFVHPLRNGTEMLVLAGRCYDRESVPFKAVDSIIESLVRYLRSSEGRWLQSEQPEDVEFLAQVFPLLRRVDWIAQRKIDDLQRTEPQKIRGRAFYGLRQLLTAIAHRTPIVIHVDDLQWGDADSARAWHELLNHSDAPPLLILGSYRSDEADDSPFLQTWEQLTTSAFHRIESQAVTVEPLSADECLELATLRTGLPRETIDQQVGQLFHDTDGNPYFLDQLLDGFDTATGSFRPVPLDEMVAGRLSRLPAAASRLLEVIAISGQPIRIAEAATVADAGKSALATLTHMRSERLVRLLDGGVEPMIETWHDKVRESVLLQLSPERRKQLHLKLGEEIEGNQEQTADDWLESLRQLPTPGEYEFLPSERLLDLCQHFSAAEDRRAFVYQWLAGEQAMRGYAVQESYELFQQARSSLPSDESSTLHYRLWMGLGRVCLWNKSPERATEAYQYAVEKSPGQFETATAYAGVEAVNMQLGQFDEAIRCADLALAELGIRRPRTAFGQLISFIEKNLRLFFVPPAWQIAKSGKPRRDARLALEIFLSGSFGTNEKGLLLMCEVFARASQKSLETGEKPKIALGLVLIANVWSALGVVWLGRCFCRRAKKTEATIRDPELTGVFLWWSGLAEYWPGELQAAKDLFEQAYAPLERCCRFGELQHTLHMHRHILAYIGDSNEELEKAQAVLELAKTTGNIQGVCWGSYDAANALARAGDLAQAARHMQQANCSLPDESFLQTSPIRASTDAYVRLQGSDYPGARRLAGCAWSAIREGWLAIDVTLLCVPILIESIAGPDWLKFVPGHERRSLKRGLRRAMLFYSMLPNQHAHLQRVCGRGHWRLGKQRKALRHFEKAVQLAEKKGMKYQQGKALLDLAAVKETDREANRTEAIRLLKEMKSVIPRAESWLLGDQYDEAVVAPEFDLEAWEREHGAISPQIDAERKLGPHR